MFCNNMDIIWGNVGKVISGQVIELNVTHRKDGNKNDYADVEKIKFSGTDLATLPSDPNEFSKEDIEKNLGGAFVKCEIKERDSEGNLVSFVSHSGQGGY